jgi:hypothetical protein
MRTIGVRLAPVVAGILLLSGCGMFGGKETKLVCPLSTMAPDTNLLAVFRPGTEPRLENVLYGVEIASFDSKCERVDKGLMVKSKIVFKLASNDKSLRNGSFSYFVSVVDGEQNILTKQVYAYPFEFDPRYRTLERTEDLVEDLPLRNVSTGGSYAILVGLQLTPEQLAFNRDAKQKSSSSPVPPVVSLPPANGESPPKP